MNRKNPPSFTVDLDSCLADTTHRQVLLPPVEEREGYDWEKYASLCLQDEPIQSNIRLVEILAQSMGFFVVSARIASPQILSDTKEWLHRHLHAEPERVVLNDLDPLFPHQDYKAHQIGRLIEEGYDIRLHIDDWAPVEESLRPLGVPCIVVATPQQKIETQRLIGNV